MGPQKAAGGNEWHCSIRDGLITMQADGDGDGVVDGLVLPSTLRVGEAMNKFVAISDEFYGLQSQNVTASFSSFPPISATAFHDHDGRGADRFSGGIPLPHPSPWETMLLHGYGGLLPFESSKCAAPSELFGKVEARPRPRPPPPLPPPPPPPAAARAGRGCHRREWMMMEQAGLNSNSQGSSQFSNELSLSLVSSRTVMHGNSIQEQCSEQLSSCSEHASCSSKSLDFSSRLEPPQLPPSLSGSRFLQAMQEILAGIACYALMNFDDGVNLSHPSTCNSARAATGASNRQHERVAFVLQKQETNLEAKKKHLLALLQMVDEQYTQCLDEIHTVTSAFHAVTELDPNLHARFALPTISLMYKSLRERISTHILASGQTQTQAQENKAIEACFIQKQWALQQLSKRDHQLWRPQRGLPETSVSVLRTWMFQNFLHPYPKDSEKHLLALKSGLTRNQVSNWFINARVRLWKPMIEEMCAEMNRRKARREDAEMEGSHRNQMRLETRRLTRD